MELYKSNFEFIILIFSCFLTPNTADKVRDLDTCFRVIEKYCKVASGIPPKAIDCIRVAIDEWHEDTLPFGVLREYYLTFLGNINANIIMTPNEFCSRPRVDENKCKSDLTEFQSSQSDALEYALYKTTINKYYERNTQVPMSQINYGFRYMMDIKLKLTVFYEGTVVPPLVYCYQKCVEQDNSQNPLDWTPYFLNPGPST